MRLNAHYNVAPRYSAGSPAPVSYDIAARVAVEERGAYRRTLEGAYGPDDAATAKQRGLRGIVELRHEVAGAWLVSDLITEERFIRPFAKDGEKPKAQQLRELRLKAKHHLPLERELPPPTFRGDFVVSGHGSVYLVLPITADAREHLLAHLGDDAQWFGNQLAVEHRYIEPLIEQLRNSGWTVGFTA